MTIAQSTTMQAYQLNAGGTRARMAILRMIAAGSANNRNESTRLQPGDWRGARHWKLNTWRDAYGAGIHQGKGQWYSHGGEQFRDERDAQDVASLGHTGWFTDIHQEEMAAGIVARLSHGRFIAGYRWTSNGERVYYPEVFDDEEEAARAADGHAENFAESAREYDERFNAMADAEGHAEEAAESLGHAFKARNVSEWHRDDCREKLDALREARDTFAEARDAYNRG